MKLRYLCNSLEVNLQVDPEANQVDGVWRVTLPDGVSYTIDVRFERDAERSASFDLHESDLAEPKRYSLPMALTERGIEISYLGRTYVFNEPRTDGASKRKRAADSGSLTAPMVGVLSELFVAEEDTVAAYQPLAIVEAMKVMATIESPFAGTVKRVYAKKGAQLKHGELIVDIVPVETK